MYKLVFRTNCITRGLSPGVGLFRRVISNDLEESQCRTIQYNNLQVHRRVLVYDYFGRAIDK